MEMDTHGNLFVGGRDGVYLFEADGAGFKPRKTIATLPNDTWAYSLQVVGDDLYLLTVTALYRLPGVVRHPENVKFERVVWGLPLGHIHQGFHGMKVGPDGELYIAFGDPQPGVFRNKANAGHLWHWTFLSGPDAQKLPWTGVGGVIRYNTQTHNLNVVSRGYRNICDLDFDEYWNLFGNDNDQEGSALHTFGRLIHVTEGSHYQWSRGWLGVKEPYRNDLIKTIVPDLGRFVPFGTCYYNEDHLGEDYKRSLYVARWGSRELGQFPLRPSGSSFESQQQTLIAGQGTARPVAVFTGNAGRLFMSVCFMERNEKSPVKRTDLVMISNPQKPIENHTYDPSAASVGYLLDEIESTSWKRRFNAHREIIARDHTPHPQIVQRFLDCATSNTAWHTLAWLAGQSNDPRVLKALRVALTSSDTQVTATAADILRRFHTLEVNQIGTLLAASTPGAQLAGLRSLGDIENLGDLADPILALANSKDSHVRQLAMRIVARTQSYAQLTKHFDSGDIAQQQLALAATMWKWIDSVETGRVPEDVKLSDAPKPSLEGFGYVDNPNANLLTESHSHGFAVGGLSLLDWWRQTRDSNEGVQPLVGMINRAIQSDNNNLRKTAGVFANTLGMNHLAKLAPDIAQNRSAKATLVAGAKISANKAMPDAYQAIDWTEAWKDGNKDIGAKLFRERCLACHDPGQGGGVIGPSLADVANRFTPQYLAESVVVPSKDVSPNFQAWTVSINSKRVYMGFLSGEDQNRLILQLMDGSLKAIDKKVIQSKAASETSLMPVGLITGPDELKHIVSYLMTLKAGAMPTQGAVPDHGASAKPNVVLIMSDDMGYSDLPKFGQSEIPTPHIDRLADEGVLFTDAYVTAPICVASRMGLLTGQNQQRFGVYGNIYGQDNVRLFLQQTLLPRVFQQAGYRTSLVGKWHLSGHKKIQYEGHLPRDRGFDESVRIIGGDAPFWKGTPVVRGDQEFPAPEYLTDFWGSEACDFIDRNKSQPFFLYLAFNAVHAPMHALDADRDKFPGVKDENRRTYDGMLAAMDRSVGRVLDRLDKHGLTDNTIVIFINDNGGGGNNEQYALHSRNFANNKPLRGHKFDVRAACQRVRPMARWSPARMCSPHSSTRLA
jgi:putative heme-binding domain-containing protein